MDAKALIEQGDHLFGKRGSLLSMWQELASEFYVERADFTITRTLGDSFAEHLSSSYPLQVRMGLGNSFSPMMRPNSLKWFHMRAQREEVEDQPAKAWMEWAEGVMWRAMYDRNSLFLRSSKEADHDIATFGQAVKTIELNRNANGLLFRCWHLRDCAWCENEEGKIDTVHRKWKPTAAVLVKLFGDRCHQKVKDRMIGPNKRPYEEINCRHIVIPAEMYEDEYQGKGRRGVDYVSIYLDVENKHVMEVVGQSWFMYVIPRWQTVSGSQYAYSPATVVALPDARLLQAMTYTLLEAGEKATNPPMVSPLETIRSDVAIYAGGTTYYDADYDERTGEVLRPIPSDKSGLPFGAEMRRDTMQMLGEAFYLSKLSLPVNRPEMTAFEVGQYVQQYIRDASPIFEPLEHEDNGAVCETVFEVMLKAGAFGSAEDIPQSIRGQEIGFRFESPLHDVIERQKVNTFAEVQALTTQSLQLDPTAVANVDFRTALRDTLTAAGMPAKWLRSEGDAESEIEGQQAEQDAAKLIEGVTAGAGAAEQIGKAQQALEHGGP